MYSSSSRGKGVEREQFERLAQATIIEVHAPHTVVFVMLLSTYTSSVPRPNIDHEGNERCYQVYTVRTR